MVQPQHVTTQHQLLTDSWTAGVEAVETAIGRFPAKRLTNDCRVALFEMAGDGRLHVNVTHRHQTMEVKGWAGPGSLTEGFVHNRTFGDMPLGRIVGHIRAMVFAPTI